MGFHLSEQHKILGDKGVRNISKGLNWVQGFAALQKITIRP